MVLRLKWKPASGIDVLFVSSLERESPANRVEKVFVSSSIELAKLQCIESLHVTVESFSWGEGWNLEVSDTNITSGEPCLSSAGKWLHGCTLQLQLSRGCVYEKGVVCFRHLNGERRRYNSDFKFRTLRNDLHIKKKRNKNRTRPVSFLNWKQNRSNSSKVVQKTSSTSFNHGILFVANTKPPVTNTGHWTFDSDRFSSFRKAAILWFGKISWPLM